MPVVKPKVQYSDLGTCVIGRSAAVFLHVHHTLHLKPGGQWVTTSPVLRFLQADHNGPVFETASTIYRPYTTTSNNPAVKWVRSLTELAEMVES